VTIGLPDRDSSGSFWVEQVRYSQVKTGQRATVVLQGLFSPETTVLVNGKRLTQVVGLGKPSTPMDSNGTEDPGSGVINGSFELVNEHYVTLALNVPDGYKELAFPKITLISPSRSATINTIPLKINDRYGQRLDDENLIPDSPPPMSLAQVDFVGMDPSSDTGGILAPTPMVRLSGVRLSTVDKLWINGSLVAPEHITTVSDGALLVSFPDPGTLKWNFTAVTGETRTAARTTSTFTVNNPLAFLINGVSVQAPVFDTKKKTKTVTLTLNGNAFAPDMNASINGAPAGVSVTASFVTDTQFSCTVTALIDYADPIRLNLTTADATASRSSAFFTIPNQPPDPPKADPKPDAATKQTEIDTKKTVTVKTGGGN